MSGNSLSGHISSYGQLRSETQIQRQNELQRVGPLQYYGGTKLEAQPPQSRRVETERPPELRQIHDRAPYISQGHGVTPMSSNYKTDPGTPLGKLLNTVREQHGTNRDLFGACEQSLKDLKLGSTIMKSPPEYPGGNLDYVQDLREMATLLREDANKLSNMPGVDVEVPDSGMTLGARMKELLETQAQDLEAMAQSVENMSDPRPTKEQVGKFKSFETEAAIKMIDDEMAKLDEGSAKWQQLNTARERLTERTDVFRGEGDQGQAWQSQDPLDKKQLDKLVGKKPGFFDKLLMKIGISSFSFEERAIRSSMARGDGGVPNLPPLTSSKCSEGKMMQMYLEEVFRHAGIQKTSGEIKEGFHHSHVDVLGNGQRWPVIDKEFGVTINGETKTFKSTLTPGNQVFGLHDLENTKWGGVCCHDGTSEHAVNLWTSELRDEDDNTMFRQVRTGVNCAYEIEDDTRRKEVNLERCKEVLVANIGGDDDLYEQAQDQARARDRGENPPPLVIRQCWVSHLTPDPIRSTEILTGRKENERLMALEQNEAMQTLAMSNNGEPIDLEMFDGMGNKITVKVKYEPIMFNIGVNEGAVAKGGIELTSGWEFSNTQFNNPSMQQLMQWKDGVIGELDRTIRENQEVLDRNVEVEGGQLPLEDRVEVQRVLDEAKGRKERIEALSQQVTDLWTSGDYKTQGNDPYKFTSRIQLLAFECGLCVTTNCKSNKDRNSFSDVSTKDLSIGMRARGELRGPDQPRSREEQLNLRTISRECGNSELQELNVGGAGYKLKGVETVFLSMGLDVNDLGFLRFGPNTAT